MESVTQRKLNLQPISYREACVFVNEHHRHHNPPQGHKFSIGVNDGVRVVGVVIVGRPVARSFDNGWTLEVTRCCTDGTRNACSKLYGAAWKVTQGMGYTRLVTYLLESECGASVRGAGWRFVGVAGGGSWSVPSRLRVDKHPTCQKTLWEMSA